MTSSGSLARIERGDAVAAREAQDAVVAPAPLGHLDAEEVEAPELGQERGVPAAGVSARAAAGQGQDGPGELGGRAGVAPAPGPGVERHFGAHPVYPHRNARAALVRERADKKNVIISPFVPCFDRSEDWEGRGIEREREGEKERGPAPYLVVVVPLRPTEPTDPLLHTERTNQQRLAVGPLFLPSSLPSSINFGTKVITTPLHTSAEEQEQELSLLSPQLKLWP